jgi:hypothetical protein
VTLEFDHNIGMYDREYMDYVLNQGWRMPNKAGKREYADFDAKRKLYNQYRDLFGIDKLVITARGRTLVAGKFREWGE